jgi:hypothetical protein
MKRSIIISMALFFLLALSSTQVQAQWVLGASLIQEIGDSVQLYTATALDAYAYEFYDAAIAGSIYIDGTSDENFVAENGASGGQLAETYVTVSALSDRDYFGFGDHYILYFYYDQVLALWFDRWGFSLFSGDYLAETTCYGCDCPYFVPPRLEYLFSTLVGLQSRCKNVPTLDGPDNVTRFGNAVYTINNLCRQFTISGWRFDASGNPGGSVVRSTSDNPSARTWEGPIVVAGTVSVKVNQGGTEYSPARSTQVSNRENFFFTSPFASQTDYPFTCESVVVNFTDPPQPGTQLPNLLGYSCFRAGGTFGTNFVRSGPNLNYKYVSNVQNGLSYTYTVHKRLLDSQSDFYKAQCGTWDYLTQTGFIAGNVLLDNVIQHESNAVVNSHYSQYYYANEDRNLNMGSSIEKIVGAPSEDLNGFTQRVQMVFNQKATAILNEAVVEPCTGTITDVTLDNSCIKAGNVNFFPYVACPQQ